MEKNRAESIFTGSDTTGLSREEKLSYHMYLKEIYPERFDKWSLAEMLREHEYHDRVYSILHDWFNISDTSFLASNTKYVDFEDDKSPRTFIFRFINNY